MPTEVQPQTEAAAIIESEERLLAKVEARVAMGPNAGAAARGSQVVAQDYDRELIELRDAVAEAKPEDLAPLVEQMSRLAAIRSRLGGSRSLPVDLSSPYFAHMVLLEGESRREVLVGKRGFIDRKHGIQIVDWRNAPISQVYYRYEEGDDFEEDVGDGRLLEGVVEVRRNVSISGGKLRRIGAPQGTFVRDVRGQWHRAVGEATPTLEGGQGQAARAPKPPPRRPRNKRERRTLGVHAGGPVRADKHLPEIAALIDKDQFDLITRPESGIVVIQGGAGSGKTTVALHRIAFLTFHNRRRIRASKVLCVVPSEALSRYVAGVLPALGVEGVPVVTFHAWARTMRQRMLPGTRGKYNDHAPSSVTRLKKHPAMLAIIDAFVADRAAAAGAAIREAVAGDAKAQAVMQSWENTAHEALIPRVARMRRRLAKSEKTLGATTFHRLDSVLRRLAREDILGDLHEMLTDHGRLEAGFSAAGDVTAGEIATLVDHVSGQIAAESSGAAEGIRGIDDRAPDEGNGAGLFDPEDDPLILRLTQKLRGGLVTPKGDEVTYAHVAIDEAQDRSAVEIQVLVDAAERASEGGQPSVTIAGDTAQRLVFDNGFSEWDELLAAIGRRGMVVSPLALSYRSTAEVMRLSREVLGPALAPKEPLIARSGAPVVLHQLGDAGEAVALIGDAIRGLAGREPAASVAVIARYPEQADVYFAGLERAEVPRLRRVGRQDFSFTPGVDVTDVAQVKGLEFDYVILVEVTAVTYPDAIEARHLLHIGATRAAHQLWLVATAEPSPLLPDYLK